jgi:uncharacterized membrane protein
MDITLLVLRVAHVVGAVFWVGTILFVVDFLQPALRDAGPAGSKVMQALQRRSYFTAVPVTALVTLVSGFWLYWRDFGRFHPGPGASGAELSFGIGGLASVVAFALGIAVMRPSALGLGRLAGEIEKADPGRRETLDAEVGRLRGRLKASGRIVVVLLTVAMVSMAIGRYL